MAKKNKAADVLDSAPINEANTIIRKLIDEPELRDAVRQAIDSGRNVVDRVSSTKKPSKLLNDKKLQRDVLDAVDGIRTVALSLAGVGKALPQRKKKKKRRLGRLLVLGTAGGGVAVVASGSVRGKLLDALFGAEEEFEYTPPTAPPATDTPGSPLSAV